MSTFLTWFFETENVTELLMSILSLDHITGPIYLYKTVFPLSGIVFILGVIKLSDFLRL